MGAARIHESEVGASRRVTATMRVTAIMPTADRRAYVGRAIAAFQRQTCNDRELLILDTGRDAVADLIPPDPRIRYWRDDPQTIGAARNALCAQAAGAIIVHWDDDDWHGPTRLAEQVAGLVSARADIGGMATVPFLSDDATAAWDYVWEAVAPWVYGGSFAYTREFWARRPFADIQIGEDSDFVLNNLGRVLAFPDASWFIARVHPGNTARKNTGGAHWYPRDPAPLLARIAAQGGRW
jgi:glycosyltransferase involved in cell wall biosynthesis